MLLERVRQAWTLNHQYSWWFEKNHLTCCRLILRTGEDFLRIGARRFAYRRKVFCV